MSFIARLVPAVLVGSLVPVLAWRTVPFVVAALGPAAADSRPFVAQALIARPADLSDDAFERRLIVVQLATAAVELTLARSDPAEVEPQNRAADARQYFRALEDRLRVHRAQRLAWIEALLPTLVRDDGCGHGLSV